MLEQSRINGGYLGFRDPFPKQALAPGGPFGGQADGVSLSLIHI